MVRTPWGIVTLLCAGLFACGDDGEPSQAPAGTSSTGIGGITLTSTGTGEGVTTGDEPGTSSTSAADTSTGEPPGSTTGADSSTGAGSSTGEPPGAVACEGGKPYACGDGLDNDGDGKIDNADFECISPCDDDEASFQTDLPGMAEDCKNDCYWDLDSGAGQDKCEFNLKCDPQDPGGQIGCGFVDECPAQTSQQCLDACVPLIPNGCDCFGCCHIATPDGIQDLYLDSSPACALDNLAACNKCTFQEQCANLCEGCEVCFGESEPPEGCDPDVGGQCDEGVQTCTMGGSECAEDEYCQTGCCKPLHVPG